MTSQPEPTTSRARALLTPRVIGAAIAVVLLLTFIVQNQDKASVHFLFWERQVSIAWALLIAGALGLAFGLALPRLRRLLARTKA